MSRKDEASDEARGDAREHAEPARGERVRVEPASRVETLLAAQRHFADKAQAYRDSPTHANEAELRHMIDLLAPAKGARALDVATGGGHTARALAEAGCGVVTTDATRQMRPHVLSDAQRLPFRAASFDIVASRIAPHHFLDLDAFVKESARVLLPGGAFYVFDLTTPEVTKQAALINRIERLRDPSHVESYVPSRWAAAIVRADLTLERLDKVSSVLDLEAWLARAQMTPTREAEARALLADARGKLSGYGLQEDGRMRVLRVELVARRT